MRVQRQERTGGGVAQRGTIALAWLLLALPAMGTVQARAQEEVYLDRVLALVGDDAVLYSEFNQRLLQVQEALKQQERPVPARSALEREVLERIIVESLQLQIGKRVGVDISDQELDRAMESMAEERDRDPEAWRQEMIRTGTYQEYRAQLRRELLIERVQRGNVHRKVRIEEREIDRFLKSREGTALYRAHYRLLNAMAPLESDASETDKKRARRCLEELRAQAQTAADFARLVSAKEDCGLQGGDLGWRLLQETPTLFENVLPELQPGEMTPVLSNDSGLHVGYLAGRRGGTEQFVQQHKVRHILIRDQEHGKRSRARLEEIRQRILDGEDFGIMAGNYSEDPGSADEGGSLGWVSPGEMTPAFEEVMQNAQLDAVSPVFASPYGWHILQVSGQRRKNIAEERIREQAHRSLYLRRYREELRNWLDIIRDEALVELRW